MGRRKWIVLGIIVLLVAGYFFIDHLFLSTTNSTKQSTQNGYVGDEQCKSCHYKQWNDWRLSDHYKAMLPANNSTVKGNFNNTTFTADGITSKFFKKGKEFYINTQGPDGKSHDYKIVYTFGHYPLQQYLIEFPGGRMQATRVSWDSRQEKWFHQYGGQKIAANDWLHWTRDAQNWNSMCARCHSTNLQKNYDFESDTYHTTYSVINVSCESCHGPAKLHVDYVNSSDYKKGNKIKDSYLLSGLAQQKMQLNTCTPCHMRGTEILNTSEVSDEIMDHFIPEIPSSEFFYADGQVRDEDYTYTSFLQSKMYSRGVKCSNCHDAHSGKILYAGNQLCLQCHAKKYDDASHTFHVVNTEASQCISCHMPGSYFMGNDFRHDHAFRVPRPGLSEKYRVPNACNKCHTNQTASWAASAVHKWYGPNRLYHFSEDLILASKKNTNSEVHIARLLNDTATPSIVKATALYYLKDIPTQTGAQLIIKELNDGDAQVRYRALRSLENFSPEIWLTSVLPLLSDKARAVRIAAADLLLTVPFNKIPQQYSVAFTSAKKELENYILYQTDFSTGNVLAGDYYLRQQDYYNAERFYLRSLEKDSALNYARLNLSAVYGATGKNDKALQVLEQALKTDPKNDRVYFNLALLYNEMNNQVKAEECLQKAIDLKTENPRVYYNYGLLLQKRGKLSEAIIQLKKAVNLSARDNDFNYALSVAYLQLGQIDKAKKAAMVLRQYYPDNPSYYALYQQLGM